MCDDHGHDYGPTLTRRRLLAAGGAAFAAGALGTRFPPATAAPLAASFPAATTSVDGLSAFSMAMHLHTSFSESYGSMAGHLDQAEANGVDVCWWTDHDHRMSAQGYRQAVHFTSLTNERTEGTPWVWEKSTSGKLSSSTGTIVSASSPGDPVKTGSLSLAATSKGSGPASIGFTNNTTKASYNGRANLTGQKITIDVLPVSIGTKGYLELLLTSSWYPARGGRPAGQYTVAYRFGGPLAPGTRVAQSNAGVVSSAVTAGRWNTVELNPSDDIAALWPDVDARDFSSYKITLSAVSSGQAVKGSFDHLRFDRPYASGDVPLDIQRSITEGYAPAHTSVAVHQGVELSTFSPHVNWFGGAVSLPTYDGVTSANYQAFMRQQVGHVHEVGGLASYNHPFGTSSSSLLPKATQDVNMQNAAASILANGALGCDVIEVGYVQRGRADLAHHVGVWDVLSRNGIMLTGNGTSDDHYGSNWAKPPNNWTTSVWAPSTSEGDLLAALVAGRAWMCSMLTPLSLDLLVDDTAPMGSATVSSVPSRQLRAFAGGVPAGGSLQVLRGEVDNAGSAAPVPNAVPVASVPERDLSSGSVTTTIDTTTSCFVRTAVLDAGGTVRGLSNPVWLLREEPSAGVAPARAR